MRIDRPRAKIKDHPQTDTPIVGDNTLVDDPVALVDDPVALVGGKTSIHTVLRHGTRVSRPLSLIRIRR